MISRRQRRGEERSETFFIIAHISWAIMSSEIQEVLKKAYRQREGKKSIVVASQSLSSACSTRWTNLLQISRDISPLGLTVL